MIGYDGVVPHAKPKAKSRVTTAIRLPEDTHARLWEAANDRDVSMNHLVVKAVEEFLERLIPADEWRMTRDIAPSGALGDTGD